MIKYIEVPLIGDPTLNLPSLHSRRSLYGRSSRRSKCVGGFEPEQEHGKPYDRSEFLSTDLSFRPYPSPLLHVPTYQTALRFDDSVT